MGARRSGSLPDVPATGKRVESVDNTEESAVKSWRETLAPHDLATVERAERQVELTRVRAGTYYLLARLAALLDHKESFDG